MFEYTEEFKVYGVTTADLCYTGTPHKITGTGAGGAITNIDIENWFEEKKHTTLPDKNYSGPSHAKLEANADLQSVLVVKHYDDVDAMKSAVLSDGYISTIDTYATRAEYYQTEENKLKIKLYFNTETARTNWMNAIKDRPSGQFKVKGVVVNTI